MELEPALIGKFSLWSMSSKEEAGVATNVMLEG